MSLSIGLLIIGSLYWDAKRAKWRNSRLRMDQSHTVTAPIRYGRLSESRGNTYTMVFSRGCELGQAKVVLCRSTGEHIIEEAEHLWAAERNKPINHRISADWGCVALLVRDRNDLQGILSSWTARVAREPGYKDIPQIENEGRLISGGVLQISWPTVIGTERPAPFDLLLATATCPTLIGQPPRYPDVQTIAAAWRQEAGGHVSYFRNNRENGIQTFQDAAIAGLL